MRRGILAALMLLGLALMLVGANLRYTVRQGSFYFDESERARFVSMLHDAGLVQQNAHQPVFIEVVGPALEVGSRTYTFRIASYRTDEEAAIGAGSSKILPLPVVVQRGNILLSYSGAQAMEIDPERVRRLYEEFSPSDYPINVDAITLSLARLNSHSLWRNKRDVVYEPILWTKLVVWFQTRRFNLLLTLGKPLYPSPWLRSFLSSFWIFGVGGVMFAVSLLMLAPEQR